MRESRFADLWVPANRVQTVLSTALQLEQRGFEKKHSGRYASGNAIWRCVGHGGFGKQQSLERIETLSRPFEELFRPSGLFSPLS
jgi:hypothetical protein